MKIICAWCGKSMGYKKGNKGEISHGICPECKKVEYDNSNITVSKKTEKEK